jgi:hypothetical protein
MPRFLRFRAKMATSGKGGWHFLVQRLIGRVLVAWQAVRSTVFAARTTLQWRGGIPGTFKKCRSMWALCGPKRPYLVQWGATFWGNDEFRGSLWAAMQGIRYFLRCEVLSNVAGEFRGPETKAVPLWPFVVRHGPSWNLGMRTVVSVQYSPPFSMERQTDILFPLLVHHYRYFCRAQKMLCRAPHSTFMW